MATAHTGGKVLWQRLSCDTLGGVNGTVGNTKMPGRERSAVRAGVSLLVFVKVHNKPEGATTTL